MNMKRLLCMVLCLMLTASMAVAETADTLFKRFDRQLMAGNGVHGYMSVTASGVAEWLNVLLPFTATDIWFRAVGEKQGDMSAAVMDDDDWQAEFYVKDANGKEGGSSWLYGDPQGIYFKSELLPGTVLKLPVEHVNLLYQLSGGDYDELFFAFDPLEMKTPGKNGNAYAYDAVADILGIPEDEWAEQWIPVLEKYFLHLDLWLAGYGAPAAGTGDAGSLTMAASYVIPAEDIKEEAKYLVGQMLYDNDLQNLLIPRVSMEQRITYLNPQMLYFYEACIDNLDIDGDIVLSREMSARGEIVSTTVSLPLPTLPDTLISPVGRAMQALFELPYDDLLADMTRLVIKQAGQEKNITLSGEKRSIVLTAAETQPDENTTDLKGQIRITPNAGIQEAAVSAAFTSSSSHRVWQDEKYIDHDTTAYAVSVEPALDMIDADDPFRSSYVDFQPVSFSWKADYRFDTYKPYSGVQINLNAEAWLPDAEVSVQAVLRATTKVTMQELSSADEMEDVSVLSEARKDALLQTLIENAVTVMANLNGEATTQTVPAPEPTAVPPANE